MPSMAEQAAPATNNSVSVVIPAYRAAKTIERAIGSAMAQTLCPMEIIVVDDGSDDDTADIATDLLSGAVHVKFQVLVQGNIGAGAARNRGISVATADYVAFLDADDEWLPEKLERAWNAFTPKTPIWCPTIYCGWKAAAKAMSIALGIS